MKISEISVGDTLVPLQGCRDCLTAGRRYTVRKGRDEWKADLLCIDCSVGEHFLYEELEDGELKNYAHYPHPRVVTDNGYDT